jgi:hypothetical protein
MMTNKEKTKMNDLMLACRQALSALEQIKGYNMTLSGNIIADRAMDALRNVINGKTLEEDIEPISACAPRLGSIRCTEEFFSDLLKLEDKGIKIIQWQGYLGEDDLHMVEILAECPLFDITTVEDAGSPPEYTLTYGHKDGNFTVRLLSAKRMGYPCQLCNGTGTTKRGGYKCNCKKTRSKI